jgi:hypothetical protein
VFPKTTPDFELKPGALSLRLALSLKTHTARCNQVESQRRRGPGAGRVRCLSSEPDRRQGAAKRMSQSAPKVSLSYPDSLSSRKSLDGTAE